MPRGQENYAIISYTLFDANEEDPDQRQVILGQYRTNFQQACFPLAKIAVIVPRPGAAKSDFPDETNFKGRFFLCIVDTHLKFIDTETYRLFDLLSE